MARYVVIQGSGLAPSTCFPEGYDTSNLVNVSRLGDFWATFLNLETGEEVSCKDFYDKMAQERKRGLL